MRVHFALLILLVFSLTGMVSAQEDSVTLTLVTHDSFSLSEDLLLQFAEQTGITVLILRGGDAGQMVNSLHREGSNMAMSSGRMAAETVVELRERGQPMTARNLRLYREKLQESYVLKDLKKYRHLPSVLHRNKQFVTTYPSLLSRAAQTFIRVDGEDKRTKEKAIAKSFLKGRSLRGLVGDAVKIARAVR